MNDILKNAINSRKVYVEAFVNFEKLLVDNNAYQPNMLHFVKLYANILADAHHIYYEVINIKGNSEMALDKMQTVADDIGADGNALWLACYFTEYHPHCGKFKVTANYQFIREKLTKFQPK